MGAEEEGWAAEEAKEEEKEEKEATEAEAAAALRDDRHTTHAVSVVGSLLGVWCSGRQTLINTPTARVIECHIW
jgi:hypothetical protein